MAETLKDQLIRHEGLRLKPYKDTVGKLTIGIGRNLDDKGISRTEALYLLDNDVQEATDTLRKALPWVDKLDWPRKAVLINMTFNMGINTLLGFKNTLAMIEQGSYLEASENMLKSKWATQVGKRATELAEIMKTGEGYGH